MQHNRIKNPNWKEAAGWLFKSVTEDLNSGQRKTNPASGQSRTRTQDRGPLSHAASCYSMWSLVRDFSKNDEIFSREKKYVE